MILAAVVILLWTTLVATAHGCCCRSVPDPSRSVTVANLTVEVCRSGAVRVLRGQREVDSLVVVDESDKVAAVRKVEYKESTVLETEQVTVLIDENGMVSFYKDGNKVLHEENHSTKDGTVMQSWRANKEDSVYGGGQFVNGLLDYSGAPLRLRQFNTEAAVPFFVSSGGYGILWDLYGDTVLNPTNAEVALTVVNGTKSSHVATGKFLAPREEVSFELELCTPDGFGCGGVIIPQVTLSLEGKRVFECGYRLAHVPTYTTCRAENLIKGRSYEVKVEWGGTDQTPPKVLYHSQPLAGAMTLQSHDANFIDYYFVPPKQASTNLTKMDSVMRSYRYLTGPAPLFSRKAYGFWQCRERYMNQTHLLENARKYRQTQIPIDNIVQDWHYWGDLGWGPQWDPKIYPNPAAMVKELSSLNLDLMVSTWSRFDANTRFYKEMNETGLLIPDTDWFDAWDAEAGESFFRYADDAHFSIGVAYLWLDATEPEGNTQLGRKVSTGAVSGDALRNTYSLEVSRAIHKGFTKKYKNRRPFALTRSSFAGQQRYGATLWSGDTSATWDSLFRQIAMSVNYGLSGMPYWTCDTGGFFRPSNQYTDPDYRLLLLRWFQFSTFTPLLRVHGFRSDTELWNYGIETQKLIVESVIHLRYRLLPYVYSGFWRVEMEGYTMQRGLVMDFGHDRKARRIPDQFMFGEAFLVAPLYTPDSSRAVYLPALKEGGLWWDFYMGEVVQPGHHWLVDVPKDRIPLFVRSSIVVLGPQVQHAMEDMASLEVRVYPGRDSTFVLYEDDGRDPSKNRPFTTISFSWSEAKKRLTVGRREGQAFPGMLAKRTINVVVVTSSVGVGVTSTSNQLAVSSQYIGTQLSFDLSPNRYNQTAPAEAVA